ncbi:MAG: PDZ domain-containing protein [Phycisphaerae bacterium]|nr:PDZ domain-containing protein [Phycisphaerae bacterium]
MRRFVSFGPALLTILTAVGILLLVPASIRRVYSAQLGSQVLLARQSLDSDDVLERLNHAVRQIRAAVTPSVVHIEVGSFHEGPIGMGRSSASGWIYDAHGHVVTNAHVIRGVDPDSGRVGLQLFDGRVARARVVGVDAPTDIAVLRFEGVDGIVPARRASGTVIEPGERVYAFGSPFGFKFSMSEGIVSGVGRSARSPGGLGFSNFVQTDAAVNPGNSGGPLVDIRGRVVGMNVAIANARDADGTANEGQSAGISFAIPLGTIESVVEQLIGTGDVRRGFLGVVFDWRTAGSVVLDEAGVVVGPGVRLSEVQEGGPAAISGLAAGDAILTIAGQAVTSADVLRSLVSTRRPGEPIAVRYYRAGTVAETSVVLGEMPSSAMLTAGERARVEMIAGLRVEDSEGGPRVSRIDDNSPAAKAGLQVGNVVASVAGARVADAGDVYMRLLSGGLLDGERVLIVVRPEGEGRGRRVRLQLSPADR